jgi:hypothetical protein
MPYGVLFLFIIYMDPKLVFGLFQDSEDKSEGKVKEIVDFSDHPYIFMGMFTRIIFRGDVLNDQVIRFFTEIDRDLDKVNLEQLNKNLIFNRAYSYLKQLDLQNSFHVDTLLEKADDNFLQASTLALDHFLELEEYEKCSFIKNIIDFVEFSQNKLPL